MQRSEIAKKFASKLVSDLHRDELTNIMKEVEQTHNSMQQKLKKENKNLNSKSNLDQTCKELQQIFNSVEKRLVMIFFKLFFFY